MEQRKEESVKEYLERIGVDYDEEKKTIVDERDLVTDRDGNLKIPIIKGETDVEFCERLYAYHENLLRGENK